MDSVFYLKRVGFSLSLCIFVGLSLSLCIFFSVSLCKNSAGLLYKSAEFSLCKSAACSCAKVQDFRCANLPRIYFVLVWGACPPQILSSHVRSLLA